jgi:hypothetical protein
MMRTPHTYALTQALSRIIRSWKRTVYNVVTQTRRPALIVLTLVLAVASVLFHSAGAAFPSPEESTRVFRYYPETGHNVAIRVKAFYESHGGLPVFGLPLSELMIKDGLPVQYFERARIEMHPDRQLTLTPLGTLLTQDRTDAPFQRLAESPGPDRTFFIKTGHSLGGAFRDFWRQNGGRRIFGAPISEEFVEVSSQNAQSYLVQYFERARFEFHPQEAGRPPVVLLGLLGREFIRQDVLAAKVLTPSQPLIKLGSATTKFTSAPDLTQNIDAAVSRLNHQFVASGEEFSFLNMIGEVSESAGFVEGLGIVDGQWTKVVGGGICRVSTTLYRAVFTSGLPIVERHPHSRMIQDLSDIPGFDAAVYMPGLDLRWRNDMDSPIYISAEADAQRGKITVTLWGIGDGRRVDMLGPSIMDGQAPGQPIWQTDATLAADEVKQLMRGSEGMNVRMERRVSGADGVILYQDIFESEYEPGQDIFLHGENVTPPSHAISY